MKCRLELILRSLILIWGIGLIVEQVAGDCSQQYEYVNEWRTQLLPWSDPTCVRIHGSGETCRWLRSNNVTAFTDWDSTTDSLDTDIFASCSAPCGSAWQVQTTQVDIESQLVTTGSVTVYDCCQGKECEEM